MDFFNEINDLEYLFLIELKEPIDNQLLITIKAATISNHNEDLTIGEQNIGPVKSINNKSGLQYEVFFKSYAAYNIFNESYAIYDKNEVKEGILFCIYSQSAYLDYIRQTTFIEALRENEELKHYAINCLNHTIDIATMDEPTIRKIL